LLTAGAACLTVDAAETLRCTAGAAPPLTERDTGAPPADIAASWAAAMWAVWVTVAGRVE
jgi:hypothetical protein